MSSFAAWLTFSNFGSLLLTSFSNVLAAIKAAFLFVVGSVDVKSGFIASTSWYTLDIGVLAFSTSTCVSDLVTISIPCSALLTILAARLSPWILLLKFFINLATSLAFSHFNFPVPKLSNILIK